MRNHDAYLEQPFQDSLRHGEELEALEEKYQESAEFTDNFEIWIEDCLPEYQPIRVSPIDLYLGTDEYREGLDAFIEVEAKALADEDEWVYDSPEYVGGWSRGWFYRLVHRKKLAREKADRLRQRWEQR